MLNETAPQFFCAGLQGIAQEGLTLMLSFATLVPSKDHKSREYLTNVRIVMPTAAWAQAVEFLTEQLARPAQEATHPMPERQQ